MDKIPVSVTILTLNSGKTLRRTMESASFFDDIVVLDGGSTDNTLDIVNEFKVRIFPQKEGQIKNNKIDNFTEIRQKSFSLAKYDWIFYIDSDEYLSSKLIEEISDIVRTNNSKSAYKFLRAAVVDNKIVKYAFFYPEYSLRLINKQSGVYWKEGSLVHERIIVPDNVAIKNLSGYLYAIWPTYKECIQKDNYYLSLVEKKFLYQVKDFNWYKYFRSMLINIGKAFNCLIKIIKIYLKYGSKDVMPLKYQWRFIRYHVLMAFSRNKLRLMLSKF